LSDDIEFIDTALKERRSLETVLAVLVAKHNRSASPRLARMIKIIEAEDRPASERAGHSQLD
jgi:hypothetical protein